MAGRSAGLGNTEKADSGGSVKCKEDSRRRPEEHILDAATWRSLCATPVDLRRGKPYGDSRGMCRSAWFLEKLR